MYSVYIILYANLVVPKKKQKNLSNKSFKRTLIRDKEVLRTLLSHVKQVNIQSRENCVTNNRDQILFFWNTVFTIL